MLTSTYLKSEVSPSERQFVNGLLKLVSLLVEGRLATLEGHYFFLVLPVLISFGNLLTKDEAFIFNAGRSLRTVILATSFRDMFGEDNSLLNHLSSVRPLSGLSVVGIRSSFLKDHPFAAISGLGNLLSSIRIVGNGNALNREKALFAHLNLGHYLAGFLTPYYRDLIRKYNPALLNGRLQGEGKLFAERTDRALDKERVVLTFLTPVWQIPPVLPTLKLQASRDLEVFPTLRARYILRRELP